MQFRRQFLMAHATLRLSPRRAIFERSRPRGSGSSEGQRWGSVRRILHAFLLTKAKESVDSRPADEIEIVRCKKDAKCRHAAQGIQAMPEATTVAWVTAPRRLIGTGGTIQGAQLPGR